MNDDSWGAVTIGWGLFISASVAIVILTKCDSAIPYRSDATRIDMVRRGFATWEVQENGSTKFIVRDSCEVR